MANFCINHNDPEYQVLYNMTGMCEAELDALIRPYLEKYGEFPTVDMFLQDSSTEEYFAEYYNLKKGNGYYISDNEINQVEVNNIFKDLEVSVEKMGNGKYIIYVKQRALPNRSLEREYREILPTAKENTQEVPAVWADGNTFVYELQGHYYKTNQRIASPNFLVAYNSYNTLEEAIESQLPDNTVINSDVLHTILKSKTLQAGNEISIYSDTKLPPTITLYTDFLYPEFVINNDIEGAQEINGILNINSNLLQNNLEQNLLEAIGYEQFRIDQRILNSENPVSYKAIYVGNNSYVIKPYIDQDFNSSIIEETVPEDAQNNIEAILDRLEEYYGIVFHRITTEDLENDELTEYVPNAQATNAFILNGEIYINVENSRSDAPIHELSHIIVGSLRQTNPELYAQLVNSVEQLPDYKQRILRYPNRTRMDANEEIFVDLFAKHFVKGININADNAILEKMEYAVKRNIDSAIFPYESTTNERLSNLMEQSFEDIMNTFGTALQKDNFIKVYNEDLGIDTRYTANLKQRLLENGSLKEYCG